MVGRANAVATPTEFFGACAEALAITSLQSVETDVDMQLKAVSNCRACS
jgi:hypothetical protein